MRTVIFDTVILPAPAEKLFEMYMDREAHSAFTGAPVLKIGQERGSEFKAFDGLLTGTILQVISPKIIVQSWKSVSFKEQDPDSTLILSFTPEGDNQGRIDLIHLDVPDHDYDGVAQGWKKRYWTPWRTYLENSTK